LYVVGTAGHVDHGKSTLVLALTGIDPDRLQEEKERGMTIDLGFAWLKLPSGREVSIVDVPGHERFIRNMLAGVGGIDLALLVVAADEGVMPQTEEHLSILELLRVKRAVVALTKRDLVESDWLELVLEDVGNRIARSKLAGAPIVVVSAVTGEGLPDLLATLDRSLDATPVREDLGRPRLPIDRVFTVAGFGTVVTGTLIGGKLQAGQELEVQPGGFRTRARGIQTHKRKADVALPGSRVAVNLAGLATTDLVRGQVVTLPGWLRPTIALDASIQVLPASRPLVHNAAVTFHTGAAESPAKVLLLEGDQLGPGASGWVQIRLASPVAVAKGDLFVLRSSEETVGGGEVVEPHARRHRRRQAAVVESLTLLQKGTPEELALQAIDREARGLADTSAIAQRSGLSADVVRKTVAELVGSGRLIEIGDSYASLSSWGLIVERLLDGLGGYHRLYPLRGGMPREELKARVGLATRLYNLALERLAAEGRIALGETTVRLAEHSPRLDAQQTRKVEHLVAEMGRDRFSPPSLADLARDFAIDGDLFGYLIETRRIVRLNDSVAFLADVYDQMVARLVEEIRGRGEISVAEVRDLFGTSRKYALALVEHLDEARVTRRVGDARVLR
jgi:selenocysteine-specific elongation factor